MSKYETLRVYEKKGRRWKVALRSIPGDPAIYAAVMLLDCRKRTWHATFRLEDGEIMNIPQRAPDYARDWVKQAYEDFDLIEALEGK